MALYEEGCSEGSRESKAEETDGRGKEGSKAESKGLECGLMFPACFIKTRRLERTSSHAMNIRTRGESALTRDASHFLIPHPRVALESALTLYPRIALKSSPVKSHNRPCQHTGS